MLCNYYPRLAIFYNIVYGLGTSKKKKKVYGLGESSLCYATTIYDKLNKTE